MSRQQRRVIASSTEQSRQFDPGGLWEDCYFCRGEDVLVACPFHVRLLYAFCFLFVSISNDARHKGDETRFLTIITNMVPEPDE